ncbi:MAG: hypothetical protein H7210_11885 [Pyrinomonadaceae bacterium]|nr:hypothetical protein [Phycisphaerales bacterium]
MSNFLEQTIKLRPPYPGRKFIVRFSPVRGAIHPPMRVTPESIRAEFIRPRGVQLLLPPDLPGDTEIDVTLAVSGEPIGQYVMDIVRPPRPAARPTEVAGPRDWGLICKARQLMTDPEQAYFFELDRTTNVWLLDYADDLTRQEKEYRKRVLNDADPTSLISQLTTRLKTRFTEGLIPRPLDNPADAEEISRIFRGATRKLQVGEDWDKVGHSLRRFAAGELMANVLIDTTDNDNRPITKNIIVTAPDSFYIFFYAEFALACLQLSIDVDMWESLLPYLVDMQRIYSERFTPKPSRLREYFGAPVRRSVPPLPPSKDSGTTWEEIIRRNLCAAANQF